MGSSPEPSAARKMGGVDERGERVSSAAYALIDVALRRTIGFFPDWRAADDEKLRQMLLGQPHMLKVVRRDAPQRRHLPRNERRTMSVKLCKENSLTVEVDGYSVPYIEAHEHDGRIHLILDRRFGIDTNSEEIERWLPFLANAMAVAAGRTSHGEHSNIRNPHGESLAGYPTERILGEPLAETDA